jgi:uncharacterized protein (UPF0548 family)
LLYAREPDESEVRRVLRRVADAPFTHDCVGASNRDETPPGYRLDAYGVELGRGRPAFERARAALARFAMYPTAFMRVVPLAAEHTIAAGAVFGALARHLGFWSLNPGRILYVVDDSGPLERWGFGFGTLPGHAESGEERFTASFDHERELVRYDVRAFSRPHAWYARLGAAYARRLQLRFARQTQAEMRGAVERRAA